MIIDEYKIENKKVLLICFRNTNLSLFNHESFKIIPGKYDRYFERLFFYSFTGQKIIQRIKENNFITYSPLANIELNWVIRSKNNKGYIYIEELQLSWMNIPLHSHSSISLKNRLKKNWNNRLIDKYWYRDDASAFIAIHPDAYPCIKNDMKFLLNNWVQLKKHYSPKLIGVKRIGLTCASRRLKKEEWPTMIKKLLKKLPIGSIVKPHPSFICNEKINTEFKKVFKKISNGKVDLCQEDVIIELEMLYEKKEIIGPQTSLSKYAEYLGSTFNHVKLY